MFIVLFWDTRAELSTPRQQLSFWAYLRSWLKDIAKYRFILQLFTLSCFLLHSLLQWLWHGLTFLLRPRKPPDLAQRRRNYNRLLARASTPKHGQRKRNGRVMAAVVALSQLAPGHSFQHPTVQTLANIIRPPPSPSLSDEFIDALSLVINKAEADGYHSTLATFDTDSVLCGIDSRASKSITDSKEDVVPGTLHPTHKRVKVFGGVFKCTVFECTIKWSIWTVTGSLILSLSPIHTTFQREV